MKECATCRREYLDSYEACPFCERESREQRRLLEGRWEQPHRVNHKLIAVVGSLASLSGIIIYIVAQVVLGTLGVQASTTVAQKEACFLNQGTVERAADVYAIQEDGVPPARVSQLQDGYIDSAPVCPAGGTYSWLGNERRLVCTVHGWHGEASANRGKP